MVSKKIVGCCGSFDYIIHEGHISFLNYVKSFGEVIVFLVPDNVIEMNKNRRVIYSQNERKENLEKLEIVDRVICLTGIYTDDFDTIVDNIDLYIFGQDQKTEWDRDLKSILFLNNVVYYISNERYIQSTANLLIRDKQWFPK